MAKTKRIEDVSGSGRVEKHVDIENMKFSVFKLNGFGLFRLK